MSISVKGFLEFVDSKPRDEGYEYVRHLTCAAAQYHRHIGESYMPVVTIGKYEEQHTEARRIEWLSQRAEKDGPATFGKLADFIRAHM